MTDNEVAKLQKEVSLLYRVAQTVHSLELKDVLREIVSVVIEVSHADSVLIYVLDPKKSELILRASKNPHAALLQNITMKMGEGITGWVARQKQPVAIAEGASKDSRFKYFRNLPEDTYEAFLSVPIITKRGVVGVINIQHKAPHAHSQMEINLLTAVGKLVGGAVENALLIEETLSLKESLELRKLVEKAKGILMKRKGLSEEAAYKVLQKKSMDLRKSLKEMADAIIIAEQLSVTH
ncbi:MAG TPA: ANTAR domain-containing protein [Patescibacteria group bacterium]|jgi:uroporphyrinogen-III synthase|nr:ANTAR domain-containing protein [Patescibacteria group bacterium]